MMAVVGKCCSPTMAIVGKCCSPTTAIVRKCYSLTMAIIRKCYSLTMAIIPLSPLHHITYANSSEFRNLLKWLRTSSLPKQETSYWPLMHDPCMFSSGRMEGFYSVLLFLRPRSPEPLQAGLYPVCYISAHRGICHFHHLCIPGWNPFLLCRLGYFD
jgi:hypothetical protein